MWIPCLATFLAAAFSVQAATAREIRAIAEIVDADTIYLAGTKIRFEGIDAPEMDQRCLDAQGDPAFCGQTAKAQLENFAKGHQWVCTISGRERYDRDLATCEVNGQNVNRWLVRNGWALAFRRYSKEYIADEDDARAHKRGLWAGAFIAPWNWRRRNTQTEILGAQSVPTDAQRQLISPISAVPPTGCAIKANLKSKSECIYHVPGGRFYDALDMSSTATRRWFCQESEATAAGCRKSKL